MILLGTMGLLIIALALLIISTKFGVSLYSWIASLFFILAAWYARAGSTVENDFYFVVYIISSFLIFVAVITGMYIALEDRKAKRGYKGSWDSDSEMSEGNIRNRQITEHHAIARKKLPKKKFNPMKWAKY